MVEAKLEELDRRTCEMRDAAAKTQDSLPKALEDLRAELTMRFEHRAMLERAIGIGKRRARRQPPRAGAERARSMIELDLTRQLSALVARSPPRVRAGLWRRGHGAPGVPKYAKTSGNVFSEAIGDF